ncbi:MAG: copper resistance protein CopD [Caulobacteraceae bacterium]|nr:copper resistance protein CopD [Caulobacteraceae bacterium]
MIETVVVAARTIQFLAATVLFGTPLFLLYGLKTALALAPARGWPRPLFAACAGAVGLGALASLMAQTAVMAGHPAAAFDRETLFSVLTDSAFGLAILIRAVAAAGALAAAITVRPGRGLWSALAALGAIVLASFAWSGHGATEEGVAGGLHAAADILHLLAAGLWLGALAGLAILLAAAQVASDKAMTQLVHGALAAFSGIGAAVVAVIVASGLINSWFLVGPSHVWQIGGSTYGRLLLLKLALFVAMLGLAGLNRYRLTPGLARGLEQADPAKAIAGLRRSVVIETAAGFAILILVSVLGTLEPVSAQ